MIRAWLPTRARVKYPTLPNCCRLCVVSVRQYDPWIPYCTPILATLLPCVLPWRVLFLRLWVLSTTGHVGLPCIASTCDATLLFPFFWSCWMETVLGRFGNDEQLHTCRCGARRTASRDLWYRLRDLSLGAFVVSCAILQRGSWMPELLLSLPRFHGNPGLPQSIFSATWLGICILDLHVATLWFLSALLHSTRWNLMQKHKLAICVSAFI